MSLHTSHVTRVVTISLNADLPQPILVQCCHSLSYYSTHQHNSPSFHSRNFAHSHESRITLAVMRSHHFHIQPRSSVSWSNSVYLPCSRTYYASMVVTITYSRFQVTRHTRGHTAAHASCSQYTLGLISHWTSRLFN